VFSEDVEEQVRGTFRNIALTLAEAGLDWSNVVELNSYHVGLQDQAECYSPWQPSSCRIPFRRGRRWE